MGPTGLKGITGSTGPMGPTGPNLLSNYAYLSRKGVETTEFPATDKIAFTSSITNGGINLINSTDISLPVGTYLIIYYVFSDPPTFPGRLELYDINNSSTIPDSEYATGFTRRFLPAYGQIILTFSTSTTIALRVSDGSPTVTIAGIPHTPATTVTASMIITKLV
jgi:hypothetical protein